MSKEFDEFMDGVKNTEDKTNESKDAIGFYRWMLANDIPENAEEFFHYSDEDMYNDYKSKQKI